MTFCEWFGRHVWRMTDWAERRCAFCEARQWYDYRVKRWRAG